ncbi:MAG: hypothetical protein HRT73_06080 [Flavobacteriales bacterium]|nr:hypothetical protein [Flavobacteriales bacterium]NQX97433.1 hypothetical protein [Flavobacteriales bacterium]
MKFNEIEYKKPFFKINNYLNEYLNEYSRSLEIPLQYEDLLNYSGLVPLENEKGDPTLWNRVLFHANDMDYLYAGLVEIYRLLISDGSKVDHLTVDGVDFCGYGNSKPFRIKILNQLNDNYDYYYIKIADASRVYGLELEHHFSPNKINYIYHKNTLVEEHIIGIPGDQFIEEVKSKKRVINEVRLAKEFVKFNEQCFVRLLGDMRSYNYVIVVTQDFDQIQYRVRAIDFDQQSFEKRCKIYLPQFYVDNVFYVEMVQRAIPMPTIEQYQKEEKSLLKKRYLNDKYQIDTLIDVMKKDVVSFPDYVENLKQELAKFHTSSKFLECKNMGELLKVNITTMLEL